VNDNNPTTNNTTVSAHYMTNTTTIPELTTYHTLTAMKQVSAELYKTPKLQNS